MKKIWLCVLLFFLFTMCLMMVPKISPQLVLMARAEPQAEEESKFWSTFRRIFSRPEPAWSKGSGELTQATGARGVDEEGKLKEVYDYQAVRWMENYQLSEEVVMNFLKQRGLGPYQGKQVKGEEE